MRIIVLLIFCCTTTFFAQDISRFIDVNGRAEILAEADQIQFNINIKTVSEKLSESKSECNKAFDQLVSIFKEFSILKDDYESSPIQFGKEYSYTREKRELVGYYSTVNVEVNLKKLEDYYSFIDQLSQNNIFEITSAGYAVSDIQKYHKQAILDAVKSAKEKADYIAASMNLSTGKIIRIVEADSYQPQPRALNMVSSAGNAHAEISGKVSIVRTINMRVELIDHR